MVAEIDGLVTHAHLKLYAGRIIDLLDKLGINDIDRLIRVAGSRHHIKGTLNHSIAFGMGNSIRDSKAYIVGYNVTSIGIPLEGRINPFFTYSKVILKSEKPVEGYAPFVTDGFGNIIQERTFSGDVFNSMIDEFRRLRDLPV